MTSTIYVKPCKEKVYEYYDFNPDNFCLMEMKGKGTNVKTGDKRKIDTHFYRLSGCGLWLILFEKNGNEYDCDYRLIGIMSEFRKGKYFCTVGVKIALIIQSIIQFEGIKLREKKLITTQV